MKAQTVQLGGRQSAKIVPLASRNFLGKNVACQARACQNRMGEAQVFL